MGRKSSSQRAEPSGPPDRKQSRASKQPTPAAESSTSNAGRRSTAWRRTALATAVIVAAGCAAYWNSFDGGFVYDDGPSIADNPHIRRLWPISEPLSLAFLNGGQTVARRPMLSLSFALNHHFLGEEPWGYHLVNLAIHLAAALLLFGIVRRTLQLERFAPRYGSTATILALAVSVLWLVHPLQTESVTYLVQRAESLVGMLYLLTLYASLRGFQSRRSDYWYLAAVLACAVGMAVKEVMVTAPLIVFLYDGTFVSDSYAAALRKRWQFYSCLAATWLIVGLFQFLGFDGAVSDFTKRSPLAYALTQPGVILYYLRLSVVPHPLVMDYGWPTADSALDVVPAGCVVALLLGFTAWGLVRRRWFGFVGAFFFLYLAPSSSFVALNQNLEEHRMYLSLAAVVVLAVLGGEWLLRRVLPERQTKSIQVVGGVLILLIAFVFIVLTISRNRDYRSQLALWSDNVAHRPESVTGQLNLGVALMRMDRLSQAAQHLRKALELDPDHIEAHNRLGQVFLQLQQYDAAIAQFRESLKRRSNDVDALNNLGQTYYAQGRHEEAVKYLRQALDSNPHYPLARYMLAVVLEESGKTDEALRHFDRYLDYQPDDVPAHVAIGTIYFRRNNFERAMAYFDRAAELRPDDAEIRFLRANALVGLRQFEFAVAEYQQALALRQGQRSSPLDADIHCNLGIALMEQGQEDLAAAAFQQSLNLNPRQWLAHLTLGQIYLNQGQREAALTHLEAARQIEPNSERINALLRRARESSE